MSKRVQKPRMSGKSPVKRAGKGKSITKLKAQERRHGTKGKTNREVKTKSQSQRRRFSLISSSSSESELSDEPDFSQFQVEDYEDESALFSSESESEITKKKGKPTQRKGKKLLSRKKYGKKSSKKMYSGKQKSHKTDDLDDIDVYEEQDEDDDDDDLNYNFDFDDSGLEDFEDVGEEIVHNHEPSKSGKSGSKDANGTQKQRKRRLTNLDNRIPVPRLAEDSDSPLSSVMSENALLTESSEDDADIAINDTDDGVDEEIDNDELAAVIAADENEQLDAYDDETLAEKKKEKMDKGDTEDGLLSDDDDFLNNEFVNLLEQLQDEDVSYFDSKDAFLGPDLFFNVENVDDSLLGNDVTIAESDRRASRISEIRPRLSIVEDPRDVVLRDQLRKRIRNSRSQSHSRKSMNKHRDLLKDKANDVDNDDDNEVVEFVSDNEMEDDENEESDTEFFGYEDLYRKPTFPLNLTSTNDKFLEVYDQTGDDSYFWDYLLKDEDENVDVKDGLSINSAKSRRRSSRRRRRSSARKSRKMSSSKLQSARAAIDTANGNASFLHLNGNTIASSNNNNHHNSGAIGAVGGNSSASGNSTTRGTKRKVSFSSMAFDLTLGTSESFMNYQAFFSDDNDDDLTDIEENLPVSTAAVIGSRSVKEVLSSAKTNGGGAPRMVTWIAANDRPFEIIDGLSTRSVIPYTRKMKEIGSGGSNSSANGHKRVMSGTSDIKFDEFFNMSELDENVDDSFNWNVWNGTMGKRKVPLTAFRNKGLRSTTR